MAQTKRTMATSRTAITVRVAVPRRQPRSAIQFTAGSRAKEMKRATSSMTSRPRSRTTSHQVMTRATPTPKNQKMARGTHGGIGSPRDAILATVVSASSPDPSPGALASPGPVTRD